MHLSHFFKKIGRPVENVFRQAVGKPPVGAGNVPPSSPDMPTTDATTAPLGGDAYANAGDAVVNYQTKGTPGLQGQPQQKPAQRIPGQA